MMIDLKDKTKTEVLTLLCRSTANLIDAKVYDSNLERQFRLIDLVLKEDSIKAIDFNDKDLNESFKKLKKKLKGKSKLWDRFSVRIEPIIQHINIQESD